MVKQLLGNIKGQQGEPGNTHISDIKEFGAVGDGIADDTDALENFLNSPDKDKYISDGVYLVKSSVNASFSNVKLSGVGFLKFNTALDSNGVLITGDNNMITLNIDGDNTIRRAVSVFGGGNIIEKCHIENIHAEANNASAIYCEPTDGLVVKDNVVNNVYSKSNNSTGDFIGSSRAVYVRPQKDSDKVIVISQNTMNEVLGEEGDTVHIDSPYNAKVIIKDNIIDGFSRRGMKIQHDNVSIVGNLVKEMVDDAVNSVRAIDLVGASNVFIQNNTVEVENVESIGSSGTASNVSEFITITDNKITQRNDKPVFYGTFNNNLVFRRNEVVGGNTLITANGNLVDISDNIIHRKNNFVSGSIIIAYDNNENVKTTNNVLMESKGESFVSNASPSKIDENNKILKVVV